MLFRSVCSGARWLCFFFVFWLCLHFFCRWSSFVGHTGQLGVSGLGMMLGAFWDHKL